jgi:hypothetical protein
MIKHAFVVLTPVVLALTLCGARASEETPPPMCIDVSIPKHTIDEHNGTWTKLTHEQWQFLRGIYAMNPLTPPGLPYGDEAVLAMIEGADGGLVLFIDGDKACTPMRAPNVLLKMMDEVLSGKIPHEDKPL